MKKPVKCTEDVRPLNQTEASRWLWNFRNAVKNAAKLNGKKEATVSLTAKNGAKARAVYSGGDLAGVFR